MATMLSTHLPSNVQWVCQIKVANKAVSEQVIGQSDLLLGHNAYLGRAEANISVHSYTRQQYQH